MNTKIYLVIVTTIEELVPNKVHLPIQHLMLDGSVNNDSRESSFLWSFKNVLKSSSGSSHLQINHIFEREREIRRKLAFLTDKLTPFYNEKYK